MYTSHSIQNELIHIIAEKTRGIICDGVKNAGLFSIMADETKDYSKQDQLCFVVRYVDSAGNVKEHFLSYVQATSLNAESLSLYIKEQLIHYGLDPNNIVSQGYDGALVMSDSCSGVQVRIKEVAHYIHCYAHNLNLVLVDTVKSVPDAMEFFTLLEHIYVFMSASKAHVVFMGKQRQLHPQQQPLELQKLSDTCWICKYACIC